MAPETFSLEQTSGLESRLDEQQAEQEARLAGYPHSHTSRTRTLLNSILLMGGALVATGCGGERGSLPRAGEKAIENTRAFATNVIGKTKGLFQGSEAKMPHVTSVEQSTEAKKDLKGQRSAVDTLIKKVKGLDDEINGKHEAIKELKEKCREAHGEDGNETVHQAELAKINADIKTAEDDLKILKTGKAFWEGELAKATTVLNKMSADLHEIKHEVKEDTNEE